MNDGAFRGTLRGLSVSLLQSSLVLWPAIALTNRSETGYMGFLGTYMALDALLYPLDALKNRMYAETAQPKSLRYALSQFDIFTSYRGLISKMAFNVPFVTALYSTTQKDENSWMYWLATAALYPLNTKKVTAQTSFSSSANYRGVVPFMLVNYCFAWTLTALISP